MNDQTNRGTIGKNTRKSKDTDADISGQINVDGKDYWINGWQKKNGQDGSTFYSLSVKPKTGGTTRRDDSDSPF